VTTAARKQHAAIPGRPSIPEDVLAQAQADRAVIQDFVPLADSLEWQLGQEYLRQRGNKAFLADAHPVPFVVNNDGSLSENAAAVFFASLTEAEQAGALPSGDLFVLELGIGVGLFARFFLDGFRDLCASKKKDYYDRLTYIAADRSERMLQDVARHGVLAGHPGRYRLRLVDALQPGALLPRDFMFCGCTGKPLRAVFLNYLLDCLPAAVLEVEGESVKQLCVRTCLARGVRLEDHTDLSAQQLAKRATSTDPRHRDDLLEVYGLFASEYDYRPVGPNTLPYADFALPYARSHSKRLLHSWGALQSLERLLDLVPDDGFILVNDYGETKASREDTFEHQRFSLATFVGLNFPLLKAYFSQGERCQYLEPSGDDERGIHSRLLGKQVGYDTRLAFQERFGKATFDHTQEPLTRARECARVGRFELAATFYQEALKRQRRNWVLLNEVSLFLTFSLRNPKAGVDMAKFALTLNPACSSELWNTLGDGLFEWGRFAEAQSAYERAIRVNDSDVRARYNLAWVHQATGHYEQALLALAEAMALDKTGEYAERLSQKQAEVRAQLARRHQQEYLRMVNLVSRSARPEADKDKDAAEQAPPDPRTR